ncbi:hypothetical protein Bca52824_077912 [Brassica carinata]|uniref:Uncharacterized protein n=1 Tax=Brassica carinata TaxID=52824 RepID=A0A8X7PY47_BRACI|nr:hypothetical protein Bca52824_077912 [Brassica carinata]
MVESDLDAVVGCVDCFAQMEDQVSCANVPPPEPVLMGMMQLLYEEQEPKRQKFEDPALVPPQDQCLAQHSGSSSISVSVPNVDDGKANLLEDNI